MLHSSLPNKSDHIRWSFDPRYNPIGQAGGRPAFPGFVAAAVGSRGKSCKPRLSGPTWREARDRLAELEKPVFNRWSAEAPVYA